jgi:hypothetical protein
LSSGKVVSCIIPGEGSSCSAVPSCLWGLDPSRLWSGR